MYCDSFLFGSHVAVTNGPDAWPGANFVQYGSNGVKVLLKVCVPVLRLSCLASHHALLSSVKTNDVCNQINVGVLNLKASVLYN